MIAQATPRVRRSTPPCHAKFLAMLPAIRKQAQIAFRAILAEAREELVQEVIANCFASYLRLVKRKRIDRAFPSALARFAISQVRAGRSVGNRLRIGDVLSKHAQLSKGLLVEPRLDRYDGRHGRMGREICSSRINELVPRM